MPDGSPQLSDPMQQPSSRLPQKPERVHLTWWKRGLMILSWTLMALLLLVIATLICTVAVLKPGRLTPMVENAANRYLNADVEIGRVDLSLRASFPFLELTVDSLTVTSRSIKGLEPSLRDSLPGYADTLLAVDRLRGGINLLSLLRGRINLNDVIITHPTLNLVVAAPEINNFNIFPPSSDTTSTETLSLPHISIRRFEIENPGPLRYYSLPGNTFARIDLTAITLQGRHAPAYAFEFDGNFETPLLGDFDLSRFPFVINGTIDWDATHPGKIALKDFDIELAYTHSRLSTELDFNDNLVFKSLDFRLDPVALTDVLSTVPDSLRLVWGIDRSLETSAKLTVHARLDRPFNTATDIIPHATVDILIPPSTVRYGADELTDFTIDLGAGFHGNDINEAVFDIRSLAMRSPAGRISLTGLVTNTASDATFDGNFKTDIDLRRLPYRLRHLLDGSVSGHIKTDISGRASMSMCDRRNFHRLKLKGNLEAYKCLWLATDTLNMAYVNHASVHFDTNSRRRTPHGFADSLLRMSVTIDSVNVLHDQYDMVSTGLTLSLGSKHNSRSADTTIVTPFGGRLSVEKFNFTVLTDTFALRTRDIEGTTIVKRYADNARLPEFIFDLNIKRSSLGSPTAKMLVSDASVKAHAFKLPTGRRIPPHIKKLADSIRISMPELPVDSVYILAIEHARAHRRRFPRVHPRLTPSEREIIDWGTSHLLRDILLDWRVGGTINARRAALYTPYFPVRNRLRNLNLTFNNDSISLENVEYKVGSSDFLISGLISNLRRGLTSKGFRRPVKIEFKTLSDSINVDEIAGNIFAGAGYADSRRISSLNLDKLGDPMEDLDMEIGKFVQNAPPDGAPLLIPGNIDAAIEMKANNITYSDILLHGFSGKLLVYDGAINLHDLVASSSVGSLNLSALYSAPSPANLKFAFGLNVNDFNIEKFRTLVPPVDSIVPLLRDIAGIIDVDMAATVNIDRNMNLILPSLNAVVKLSGDSLRLVDDETFRKIGKWLLFKNKNRNIINHMSAEMVIEDNQMRLFPFMFDFDRYRIGVQGYNDFTMNFNYRISVLKSPIPFKFGISLKGTPEKYKIRFGGAKFDEKTALERTAVADTTRVNLLKQISNIFRRGVSNSRFANLSISSRPEAADINLNVDTITAADSAAFIREGLIPPPPQPSNADHHKR